jgi:hypothetical protein
VAEVVAGTEAAAAGWLGDSLGNAAPTKTRNVDESKTKLLSIIPLRFLIDATGRRTPGLAPFRYDRSTGKLAKSLQ